MNGKSSNEKQKKCYLSEKLKLTNLWETSIKCGTHFNWEALTNNVTMRKLQILFYFTNELCDKFYE